MVNVFFRQLKALVKSSYHSIFANYFFMAIFGGLLPVVLTLMPQMIISRIELGEEFKRLMVLIAVLGLSVILASVVSIYSKQMVSVKALNFRTEEFNHFFETYLNVDYEYIEDMDWLDSIEMKMRCLGGDNDGFEGSLVRFGELTTNYITIIIFTVFLTILSPWLLLLIILYLVVAYIASSKAQDVYINKRKIITNFQRKEGYYFNTASDLSYGKDIRLFNLKNSILKCMDKEISGAKKVMNQVHNKIFLWSILEVLAMSMLFGLGLYFIINNYMQDKKAANLLFYILVIISVINYLALNATKLNEFIRGIKEVKDYYDFLDENKASDNGKSYQFTKPLEIVFDNVSFKYPHSENYVFKNLSFKINPKEKIAIVGANGAGKTTIVKLMTGLFRPTEGHIYVNGEDINLLKRKDIYDAYAVVFQDINIYAFSILENISLEEAENTDYKRVMEVLKREGIYDKIMDLDKKEAQMMTKYIEPDGVEFSGGETQKLAIARALYKDSAKAVILDEPTSALDALAEANIYQSFSDLVKDKTAIYISHRLSSTKFCDRILLFDETGLAEVGTHDELMKLKKKYYELFNIQGKYYQEGGESNEDASKDA